MVPYTVPDGYRAILRDLEVVIAPGSGATAWALSISTGGTIAAGHFEDSTLDVHQQWTGRAVVDEGEELIGISTPYPVNWYLSGYLLTAP